jgi:hypothetical protein
MLPSILLLAASAVGITTGWEPLPGGGMKYIIQLEPEALEAHKTGEDLESDIDSRIHDIRSVSIRLGTGEVRRVYPPPGKDEQKPEISAKPQSLPKDPKATSTPPATGEPAKPIWLIVVSLLLSVSLGGNVYLLWIHAELRKRYRATLAK